MEKDHAQNILFEVSTPLDFRVRVTQSYWDLITYTKHPVMAGKEFQVKKTLNSPAQIRISRSDSSVYLFYRQERADRWICAVVKKINGEGFLITTYPTETIKEGVRAWPR
jgi:hypothetical protein